MILFISEAQLQREIQWILNIKMINKPINFKRNFTNFYLDTFDTFKVINPFTEISYKDLTRPVM